MTQRLDIDTFKTVVASTPLVSIDLIVRNSINQVLLGLRSNRPAQGYWFVPGGRICKDEKFDEVFLRLTRVELGKPIHIENAKFIGPYQHLYDDNFSGEKFSTHYVVLGYELSTELSLSELPQDQHNKYKWWSIDDLLDSKKVHRNTKAYFSDLYK
ncbi:GDP-mannose mannosyl hydrolase [Grimontia hollisae]|uniref:GDP-mannose mannosyl hydrolase n=1 Tax=Grimontia hollisae TaxID=673 RepID=UPI0012AC7D9F|nr:GDP-mannose mannosyl hydrolase [Grimontia hollisae]